MTEDPLTKTDAWAAFVDMRKAKGKRAPFTELAKTRILFELRRLQADHHDIEEILWTSVTNGWSGVFAPKRTTDMPMTFKERDAANAAARVSEMTGGLVSAKPISTTRRNDALQEVFNAQKLLD